MSRTTIVTTAFMMFFSIYGQAQSNPKLERTVAIASKQIRFDSLLKLIARATNFKFSFNPKSIKQSEQIKVPGNKTTAGQWLKILNNQFNLEYKIVGEHIILNEKTKAQAGNVYRTPPTTSDNFPNRKLASPAKNKKTVTTVLLKGPVDKKDFTSRVAAAKVDSLKDTTPRLVAETQMLQRNIGDSMKTGAPVSPVVTEQRQKPDPILQGGFTAAQKERKTRWSVHNMSRLEIGLQGLGIAFERKLTNKLTVDFSTGIGGNYNIITDRLKYRASLYDLGAYIAINPRIYYNGVKDETIGNDGAYVGATVKYVHDITKVDFIGSVLLLNLHWGVQKSLSSRLFINAHAGPGLAFPVFNNSPFPAKVFYPSVNFKLCYRFR